MRFYWRLCCGKTLLAHSKENSKWLELKLFLLYRAPMTFFATTDIGITTNRFSQDLELIDMELPLALIQTMLSTISCRESQAHESAMNFNH